MNKYKVKSISTRDPLIIEAETYTIGLAINGVTQLQFYTGTGQDQQLVAIFFNVEYFLIERGEAFA